LKLSLKKQFTDIQLEDLRNIYWRFPLM
jgi:hypothetical protein